MDFAEREPVCTCILYRYKVFVVVVLFCLDCLLPEF